MTLRKIQTVVSATACPRASFPPRSWPATTQHDYSQIQAPVLAFVGYPGLPQDGIRDNHVTGPGERTIIEAVFGTYVGMTRNRIKRIHSAAGGARVVALWGASHLVFLSNEEEVLREMRALLAVSH